MLSLSHCYILLWYDNERQRKFGRCLLPTMVTLSVMYDWYRVTGCGLVWKEASGFLELLLKGTFCSKMTQCRPSLGVPVCSGARGRVRAQGTSLSSTTLNPGAASRLGTHPVPAQPGTAFQPLIYHPISCLFCCICRPFTAAIYQERSQQLKREWRPSASSALLSERRPRTSGRMKLVSFSKHTVIVSKSRWTVLSSQACQ